MITLPTVNVDSKILSEALNRVLERYRSNSIPCRSSGICYYVMEELDFITARTLSQWEDNKAIVRLQEIWHRWPLFSGYSEYPIKTPKGQWEGYSAVKDKWKGKQGKLRESLILFLLEKLKEKTNEVSS